VVNVIYVLAYFMIHTTFMCLCNKSRD